MLMLLHASRSVSGGTEEAAARTLSSPAPCLRGIFQHLQCLPRHRWPEMSRPDPPATPTLPQTRWSQAQAGAAWEGLAAVKECGQRLVFCATDTLRDA